MRVLQVSPLQVSPARMAGGRLLEPGSDAEAPYTLRQQAEQAHWATLTPRLQAHSAEQFDGKQRLFLRMFAFDSGLCLRQPWSDFQSQLRACAYPVRPSAAELVAFTRRFLGLFMINRFDILMFLEDAGLWMEQGSERRPLSEGSDDEGPEWDDDDDETGEAAERKYAPVTFEAAGLAVAGLLRLLGSGGWYDAADLAPGLITAEQAAVELPRCALLGAYLPGPLNVVKDFLLAKAGGDEAQQPPGLEEDLVEKYRHIAPRFNFQRAYASVMASGLRVEHAEQRRMRVVSVENRRQVTFEGPAATNSAADADTDFQPPDMEQIMVEMDPEIGALLLPGMTVTGHFSSLSDGSYFFAQPGYIWPSFCQSTRGRMVGPADGFLSDPETSDDEAYE